MGPACDRAAIPVCRAGWARTLATHAPSMHAGLCTAGNARRASRHEPLGAALLLTWHKVVLCCKFLILLLFIHKRQSVLEL
jgi:hypothetical protein